jgi:hypothetical protein
MTVLCGHGQPYYNLMKCKKGNTSFFSLTSFNRNVCKTYHYSLYLYSSYMWFFFPTEKRLYCISALSCNLAVLKHIEKNLYLYKPISFAVHINIVTPCTKSTSGTNPVMYVNNRFSDSHRKPCYAPPAQTHVSRCNTGPANDVACIGKQQQHRCGRAGTDCKHPAHTHTAASASAVHISCTVPTPIPTYIYVADSVVGVIGKNLNSLRGTALYKNYKKTFGALVFCKGYFPLNFTVSFSMWKVGSLLLYSLLIKVPKLGNNPSIGCDIKFQPSEIISVSKRFCTMSELPTPSEGSSHGKTCCPIYSPVSLSVSTIIQVPSIYIYCTVSSTVSNIIPVSSIYIYCPGSLLVSGKMLLQPTSFGYLYNIIFRRCNLYVLTPLRYVCYIFVCALTLYAQILYCCSLSFPPSPSYWPRIYFVLLSVTICNGSCGYRE